MSLDVDDESKSRTETTFAKWASHILVGAPIDGRKSEDEGKGKRDFRGAVRYFRSHRRDESERVARSLVGLRDTVWTFIGILSKAALHDGSSDGTVRERLDRLRASIDANDHDALKREAEATVASLGSLLAERAEQQKLRMAELAEQVRRLGTELEEAKREGELDGLTRLHNRACFDRFAERTCGLAMLGSPACILMVDVDHFKSVNDNYGHPRGDAVLRMVADSLLRTFPRRDDLVARYGGEEFIVVLRNTKLRDAEPLAERVLRAVRAIELQVGEDKVVRPTVSIGVAELIAGESSQAWIERADAALYRAKNGGRNRAVSSTTATEGGR